MNEDQKKIYIEFLMTNWPIWILPVWQEMKDAGCFGEMEIILFEKKSILENTREGRKKESSRGRISINWKSKEMHYIEAAIKKVCAPPKQVGMDWDLEITSERKAQLFRITALILFDKVRYGIQQRKRKGWYLELEHTVPTIVLKLIQDWTREIWKKIRNKEYPLQYISAYFVVLLNGSFWSHGQRLHSHRYLLWELATCWPCLRGRKIQF